MSYADKVFIDMCRDIIDNGTDTQGEKVRPVWEDGTPAYTIKKFGVGSRNSDETFSYNVGCYVDDEGYLVVGGPVITEFGEKFAAKATGNWQNWKQYDSFYSYLKYSSVAEYGLYYTNAAAAIAKHGADNVVLK